MLAELARRVPEHDVLVVDDGSTDATAAVARAAGVPVARLPFNLGIGGALRTGFRYAVERGYERAVQFDADGQHDPGEIATLLAALDAGADMAVGNRFSATGTAPPGERAPKPGAYSVGRTRKRAMGLLQVTVGAMTGNRLSDTTSGFRAFAHPVLELFARTYPVDYLDSVEALLLASRAGLLVVEVPTAMRGRAAGAPSNRNFKLVYHYLRLLVVLATSGRRRPAGRTGKALHGAGA